MAASQHQRHVCFRQVQRHRARAGAGEPARDELLWPRPSARRSKLGQVLRPVFDLCLRSRSIRPTCIGCNPFPAGAFTGKAAADPARHLRVRREGAERREGRAQPSSVVYNNAAGGDGSDHHGPRRGRRPGDHPVDLHRPHQRHGHGQLVYGQRRGRPGGPGHGRFPGPATRPTSSPASAAAAPAWATCSSPTSRRRASTSWRRATTRPTASEARHLRLRPGFRHLHGGAARRRRGRPAQADPSRLVARVDQVGADEHLQVHGHLHGCCQDGSPPSRWTWAPAASI